jgi:hypothetical protein
MVWVTDCDPSLGAQHRREHGMYQLRDYVKVVGTDDIGRIEQRNKDFGNYFVEFNHSFGTGLWFSESELVRVTDCDPSHPDGRTQSVY